MFTPEQKHVIAQVVESVLLGVNNPEMPKKCPEFHLYVEGSDPGGSWANIKPNWKHENET